MRNVAVISSCIDDFLQWREDNLNPIEIGTKQKIKVDDTLFVLVMKTEHVCSQLFNEVIETADAHTNSEYYKIKEIIKGNIIKDEIK